MLVRPNKLLSLKMEETNKELMPHRVSALNAPNGACLSHSCLHEQPKFNGKISWMVLKVDVDEISLQYANHGSK